MKTSSAAAEIPSLQKIRQKYELFSKVIAINIGALQQFDKERKDILARFTAGINKTYYLKEKKVGDETERATVEMCKDLAAFVRGFLEKLESKQIQITPEEAKLISEEFDRCEDALRNISDSYAYTAHYRRLQKGNQPFTIFIWGLQLANNCLRDFAKPRPPKKEARS